MKINRTKKMVIIVIGANLLVWLIAGGILFNIYNQNATASELFGQIEQVTNSSENSRLAKTSLTENQKEILEINSHFVSPDSVAEVIEELEALAVRYGLKPDVSSVSTEQIENDSVREYLVLRFHVVGSWQNVFNFVSVVENLNYKAEIDSVMLRYEQADIPTDHIWKADFQINLLKLK